MAMTSTGVAIEAERKPDVILAEMRPGKLLASGIVFLALALRVESVASVRIWLICRVLHPAVSFWTCLQSEFPNVAISFLPSPQSGGGPGQIFLLSRGGGMADIGSPRIAPDDNLLWRFSTAYLPALAGFLCLGRPLAQDASRITRRHSEPR
jgi:hypothetical protein